MVRNEKTQREKGCKIRICIVNKEFLKREGFPIGGESSFFNLLQRWIDYIIQISAFLKWVIV